MKRIQKSAFEIKLEKETRKQLIKYISPIAVVLLFVLVLLLGLPGAVSGLGIVGFWASYVSEVIVVIVLYIAVIPFLWFMSKAEFEKKSYKKLLEDISKSLVESVMTPGEPVKVILIKAKGDFGDFVLGLQKDKKVEFYAVLGERDNLIAIYVVLKGEDKKRDLEVVTKKEFADCYRFVDDSENS